MSSKTAEKKAVARKDMTRAQWTWKEMKRNWVAYAMVAPFMLIFTCFTVLPCFPFPALAKLCSQSHHHLQTLNIWNSP